jgi:hypothetical protein
LIFIIQIDSKKNLTAFPQLNIEKRPQLKYLFLLLST